MKGRFISFEGGEGAGKSTVIAAAAAQLQRHGIQHRLTREPGGCPLAEDLRALVLDPRHVRVSPEAEALMMFAARAQHVVETIAPALEAGTWVVCDRFTDASYAYQGGGRGLPVERIAELERWAAFGLRPDLTLLLDVPVAEGLRRIAARGPGDRMEREDPEFFERVRAAYLERARNDPARFRIVDATLPLAEVVSRVEAEVARLIGEAR